jgi:hypothetical protein
VYLTFLKNVIEKIGEDVILIAPDGGAIRKITYSRKFKIIHYICMTLMILVLTVG